MNQSRASAWLTRVVIPTRPSRSSGGYLAKRWTSVSLVNAVVKGRIASTEARPWVTLPVVSDGVPTRVSSSVIEADGRVIV